MSTTPPSFLVHRLVYRDATNPGLQSGVAAKSTEPAIHLQKRFLRRVARLFSLTKQPEAERINRTLEMRDKLFKGRQISGAQPGDKPRLRQVLDRAIELEPCKGRLVQCGHVSG